MTKYDLVVVGGGIQGLSAAYSLVRKGVRSLAVIERYPIGHTHGSSHGRSRVLRNYYHKPEYVEMVQQARLEGWPQLERDLGTQLLYPRQAVVFGPPCGPMEDYVKTLEVTGSPIVSTSVDEARTAFPHFCYEDHYHVLCDPFAQIIAAEEAITGLRRYLLGRGVDILEGVQVEAIEPKTNAIALNTQAGRIEAEKLIIAAGPWVDQLLPYLREKVRVLHQTVAYYRVSDNNLPSWNFLEEGEDAIYYGLWNLEDGVFKAARHQTQGMGEDPDKICDPSHDLEHLESMLRRVVPSLLTERLRIQRCLYTVTETEDFIIDHHPSDDRMVVAAGFSGHGFKFAPVVGQRLAELALS